MKAIEPHTTNRLKLDKAYKMLRHLLRYKNIYLLIQVKPMTVTEIWIASKRKNHAEISSILSQGEKLGLIVKESRGKEKICHIPTEVINKINHFTNSIL